LSRGGLCVKLPVKHPEHFVDQREFRGSGLAEERNPPIFYGYIVVAAAFVIWFITWGMQQTFGVFFKPMLEAFAWSRAETSGARSLNAGISGLLGIFAGRMTDGIGPRKVVLFFGSLVGIGFLLLSLINNSLQFYLIYGVLVGAGMSVATVPTMTAVARWFTKRRGLMSGLVQTGAGFGGMVLAPLAGRLIVGHGWRYAYIVLGIVSLLFVSLAGAYIRRDPEEMGLRPHGAAQRKEDAEEQPAPSTILRFSVKESFMTRQFWILAVMFFAFGFCRTATMTHIAAHATDLGFSLIVGANVLAIISGTSIVGRLAMGYLSDLAGNKIADIISYGAMAGSLVWLMFTIQVWGLYLSAALFGFAWGGQAVIRMTLIAEVYGVASLGTIFGILEFISQLGAIIGPLSAGWLFDLTGQYVVAFMVAAMISVVGLAAIFALKPVVGAGGRCKTRDRDRVVS
jgi:MFS family permease